VFDALDGRVARLTRTQSEFGAEFDSLSDMVSFGAAPALLMYQWALKPMGKWGWIAAFIYCVGAALRLARFNTNIGVTMVSNVPYYSGKDFNLRKSVPFWVVPAIVVAYLLISIEPSHVLFGLFVCYALSGYVLALAKVVRPVPPPPTPPPPPENGA
jgi:CDP-diacylglycerol---serine O-phosphatidyltransferase